MKYTAAALLLAIACAGAHAQDHFVSSFHGEPSTTTISPLFVKATPVMHIEYAPPGRAMTISGLAMIPTGAALMIWGINEMKRGQEITDEYRRTHSSLAKDGGGGGGLTKEFWGGVMVLGGQGLASMGVYLSIKGAVKTHRAKKQIQEGGLSPLYTPPAEPVMIGDSPKDRALRRKISGITMVGLGAALQVAGVLMYKNGDDQIKAARNGNGSGNYSDSDLKRKLGAGLMLGGFGVAVPGTISWIKGARLQKIYKDYPSMPQASLSFKIGLNPAICYRF